MELTVGSRTDAGPRKMNQDHHGWWPELGLFVVADGMGGHNAGEVASHLAVETIHGFIAESIQTRDITWPFGLEVDTSIEVNRLITAVRLANRKIYAESTTAAGLSGMGTTVVAALINGDKMALVSVGDSRMYRLRDGALEQLTSDDTWLASVLGARGAEAADPGHPLRHVLTSVVGTKDNLALDPREEVLRAGDTLLLCSDGIHGKLDATALTSLLSTGESASDRASRLVNEAISRGTTDNATALVIAVS
jgi:serine/threonine protein phosphatase PrpC